MTAPVLETAILETPILQTRGLTVRFGGQVAVRDVSASFESGTLTAIVGPNGAGKTTYFNLVSGALRPTAGRVLLRGQDITRHGPAARARAGIGRAFQRTSLFPDLSAFENIRLAVQARAGEGMAMLHTAASRGELADRAHTCLRRVNLAARARTPAANLSHGDQRKLEVAILIALEPAVFLFDEPTAGMSVDEVPVILDLIEELRAERRHAILLVEHKMDVVDRLADRVVVLHQGALLADGPPAEVIASRLVQEAYLGLRADDADA